MVDCITAYIHAWGAGRSHEVSSIRRPPILHRAVSSGASHLLEFISVPEVHFSRQVAKPLRHGIIPNHSHTYLFISMHTSLTCETQEPALRAPADCVPMRLSKQKLRLCSEVIQRRLCRHRSRDHNKVPGAWTPRHVMNQPLLQTPHTSH